MNYLSNEVIAEFFTPLAENEDSTPTTDNVNITDQIESSPDSSTTSSKPTEQSLREKYLKQRRDYKMEINRGFEAVNSRIPFLPEKNVPQIKTLRLSIGYIRHLERILADEMITDENGVHRLLTIEDFEDHVKNEMKRTGDHAGKTKEAIQMEQDMWTPPAKKPCLMNTAGFISPPFFKTPSPVHWTPASVPQAFNLSNQFNITVANPYFTPPQTPPSPAEQKPGFNLNSGEGSPQVFKTPLSVKPNQFNLTVANPFTPPQTPPSPAEQKPRVTNRDGGIPPPVFNNPMPAYWNSASVQQWYHFWSQFNPLMAKPLMPNAFITPPQTPSGTPQNPQTPPPSADKPPSQSDPSLVFMNL